MGFGTVIVYLTYLSFLKYFPIEYLSTYLIGDYSGGIFITLLYFLLEYLGAEFKDVNFFIYL